MTATGVDPTTAILESIERQPLELIDSPWRHWWNDSHWSPWNDSHWSRSNDSHWNDSHWNDSHWTQSNDSHWNDSHRSRSNDSHWSRSTATGATGAPETTATGVDRTTATGTTAAGVDRTTATGTIATGAANDSHWSRERQPLEPRMTVTGVYRPTAPKAKSIDNLEPATGPLERQPPLKPQTPATEAANNSPEPQTTAT